MALPCWLISHQVVLKPLPPHSVDIILAGLVYCHRLARGLGCVEYLEAKSVHLHKAYEQLPPPTRAREDAFLCVWCPETGGAQIFQSLVLPLRKTLCPGFFSVASTNLAT